MTEKEIDLLFKSFKWHVNSYYHCIDKLNDIADMLSGEPSSPLIKSKEEAKYQRGTRIYTNNIPELLDEEEYMIKERNYHRYAMDIVNAQLSCMDIVELNIIDDYYWHGISIHALASIYNYSNRMMFYRFQEIKQKIAVTAMEKRV